MQTGPENARCKHSDTDSSKNVLVRVHSYFTPTLTNTNEDGIHIVPQILHIKATVTFNYDKTYRTCEHQQQRSMRVKNSKRISSYLL